MLSQGRIAATVHPTTTKTLLSAVADAHRATLRGPDATSAAQRVQIVLVTLRPSYQETAISVATVAVSTTGPERSAKYAQPVMTPTGSVERVARDTMTIRIAHRFAPLPGTAPTVPLVYLVLSASHATADALLRGQGRRARSARCHLEEVNAISVLQTTVGIRTVFCAVFPPTAPTTHSKQIQSLAGASATVVIDGMATLASFARFSFRVQAIVRAVQRTTISVPSLIAVWVARPATTVQTMLPVPVEWNRGCTVTVSVGTSGRDPNAKRALAHSTQLKIVGSVYQGLSTTLDASLRHQPQHHLRPQPRPRWLQVKPMLRMLPSIPMRRRWLQTRLRHLV